MIQPARNGPTSAAEHGVHDADGPRTHTPPPWLLLVHQLPMRPVSVRVKTWRRLQQIGAVAVKSSVYALPNRPDSREDFEWIRSEIVAAGGQATVFEAATIDDVSSSDLRQAFTRDREAAYAQVTRALDAMSAKAQGKRARPAPRRLQQTLRNARDQIARLDALDFFGAAGRQQAHAALQRLARLVEGVPEAPVTPARLNHTDFCSRRWRTRPRPGIDRLGSAWLIRRFIDSQATFEFAEDPSTAGDAVTFDMFGGAFTHEGVLCTFEVLCARFGLQDERLPAIAALVHDLDLKDQRFGRVEAPLLGAVVEGLRLQHEDDRVLLEHGIALFEALYQGHALLAAPPRPDGPRRRRGARGS